MKYNSDVWCRNSENYELMVDKADQYGNYKSYAHYLLTLMNILANSAALLFTMSLG